jgi:uncharacterized membrane protein
VKRIARFLFSSLLSGALAIIPIYLVIWLLLKVIDIADDLLTPMALVMPRSWPIHRVWASLILLATLLLVGLVIRSDRGHAAWDRLSSQFFHRIPAYSIFKVLTQRLIGDSGGQEWTPILAEIDRALVPAFIVEELPDGRVTVFVPSVPTPLAGAVYILTPNRVFRLKDVAFTRAIGVVARWGSGCRDLVDAMVQDGQRDLDRVAGAATQSGVNLHLRLIGEDVRGYGYSSDTLGGLPLRVGPSVTWSKGLAAGNWCEVAAKTPFDSRRVAG